MRYVVAGYVFVLTVLALYAVQLIWRRMRLTRAVARVAGSAAPSGVAVAASGGLTGGAAEPDTRGATAPVEAT